MIKSFITNDTNGTNDTNRSKSRSCIHSCYSFIRDIESPCSKLQGIFDPQGSTIYSNRSLTPQQATENALAPGFVFGRFFLCVLCGKITFFLFLFYFAVRRHSHLVKVSAVDIVHHKGGEVLHLEPHDRLGAELRVRDDLGLLDGL